MKLHQYALLASIGLCLPLFVAPPVLLTLIAQTAIANPAPQLIAAKAAPSEAIDKMTDYLFYQANPQLTQGQKLKSSDHAYIREWQAIRNIVKDVLSYEQVSCGRDTPKYDWSLRQPDGEPYPPRANPPRPQSISPDLNDIADAIFTARNPDLGGRKIRSSETSFIKEWRAIRKQVSTVDPCY